MADRRMFHKHVVDSDMFLDMPASSQALYFHLAMRADDEGFIGNPKKIQKMIGANDDDSKILLAKEFLKVFKSGIVVVSHWNIHNTMRKDRFKETIYKDEKNELVLDENNVYVLASKKEEKLIEENKKDGNQMATQNRLDYTRLDKNKEKQPLQNIDSYKSGSKEKNKFLEEWLTQKSKNKLNPSAYKANLIKRLESNEESVIDEYNFWYENKIYQDILENAIGKTIKTTEGTKTILSVEPENGKLNIFFKEGSSAIIANTSVLKKITNQKNNEETK